MGWKTSMILMNSEEDFNLSELFGSMGYYQLEKVDEQYFESIMNPDDDKIYIGKFNGNTIICMQDLPLESLGEEMSRAEKVLSKACNNSDVVTFILHSVVNLWGYSVVKQGKKVRVRAGSSEGGIIVEHGEIIKEEEGLMSQSQVNENGDRVYVLDDMPDEEFTDDQVGENFVFDISVKYFGEAIDMSDDLFATKFVGYTFSKKNPQLEMPAPKVIEKIAPKAVVQEIKKPWWKFW